MRLLKHIFHSWLRTVDRTIASLGSSRLTKHDHLAFLRNLSRKVGLTRSSRVVRHNRPSHLRNISRSIASIRFLSRLNQRVTGCVQSISRKAALAGSKRLVRHNCVNGVRNTSRKIAVVASTTLLGGGALVVAQADESLTEFTRRAYVGIGGGATFLEPKTPNANLTVSSKTDSGFHIVGGYDFTSRISAELYYADLGAAEIAFIGTDIGDINYQVFGLSAIGYLYNSRSGFRARSESSGMGTREGLSLFTRVGVGGVSADSELDYKVNHRAHLALGLGAEYGFRNGFAVRGEYRALDTDQHYGTVSLVKRFGKVRTALPAVAAMPVAVEPLVQPEIDVEDTDKTASFAGVQTVNFALDKSNISDLAASKLDEVAAVLGGSDTKILLEGHTDWIASERYNYQLSLRRAESVRRYLESKGVDRKQIAVRGYGETRPVAINDTVEGRASNRRVDIRLN